jgi:hypothetical protein
MGREPDKLAKVWVNDAHSGKKGGGGDKWESQEPFGRTATQFEAFERSTPELKKGDEPSWLPVVMTRRCKRSGVLTTSAVSPFYFSVWCALEHTMISHLKPRRPYTVKVEAPCKARVLPPLPVPGP